MIFNSIQLINFRQYRGENTFEFPVKDDKKITLIIAPNGVGKTTFSQAVRFCFYGDSPNVLRLPKPEENLNYSVVEDLSGGEEAILSVRVGFSHNSHKYLAARTVTFVKESYASKPVKKLNSKFELWEDNSTKGLIKLEDGDKLIKQIMPIGLAHIYMFDGERVEKPIGSSEFKKDLKESIIGVLGLNKLAKAQEFLGAENKRSSLIGKVASQIQPQTATEQKVLKTKNDAEVALSEAKEEKAKKEHLIEKLTQDINEAKIAQASVAALKNAIKEKELIEKDINNKEKDIQVLVEKANTIAVRLMYKLELAKTYPKYLSFLKKEDTTPEVFENLYESVIKDILNRGLCICGREVHEGSHEVDVLRSLAVLPHDNAHYLNSLKSLYASLDDMMPLKERMDKLSIQITKGKRILEEYRKKLDTANENIKEKEKEAGVDNQTNIDVLMKHRAAFDIQKRNAENEINKNENILANIQNQLNKIDVQSKHNLKVNQALKMLEALQINLQEELNSKEKIAKTAIQSNMNKTLRNVMTQNYAVELDDEYSMRVWKQIAEDGTGQDETEVLSTGQNVVIYLSFLRALLMTIEEHSEFNDVQSSGVIMDAALSNLDEEHISNISRNILGAFDELIFLSYKAQLRNELISGIKDNISKVYELSKDKRGNILVDVKDVQTIEEYVNEEVNEDE